LFLANSVQVGRYISYLQSIKDVPAGEQLKVAAKEAGGAIEGIASDTKAALRK
jgi:hypothetical protein